MPQYDNPAAFLSDPSDFPGGPSFLTGMAGMQRQLQKQPFLQELLQQQQMNTQKQSTELQEFQSPLGVQERQAQKQKIIDEGDVYNKTKSDKILKEKEASRLLPYMTNQQIEEAKVHAQQSKHLFDTEPMKYFSGIFNIIKDMPDQQAADTYNKLVKMSGYDVSKLDPDIAQYDPKTTKGHLAAARYAQVHTPEQEQKERLAEVPGVAQRDVAKIGVAGRIAEMKMQIDAGKFDSMPRYRIYLNKVISTGVDPETHKKLSPDEINEARNSLRRSNWLELQDRVSKDPLYQGLSIMAMTGDKDAVGKASVARQEAEARHMKAMGISPQDFGQAAPLKVGSKVKVGGANVTITGQKPDGSYTVKGDDGRTGTYRP